MDSPHKLDPNKFGYNEMEGEDGAAGYFMKYGGPPGNGKSGWNGRSEMEGNTPVYEMPAGEIHEMPTESNTTHKGGHD